MSNRLSINVERFLGQKVALQLAQPMLMMGPSADDEPRPIPVVLKGRNREGQEVEQPVTMIHLEGTLTALEPTDLKGMIFDQVAQDLVHEFVARADLSDEQKKRLVDRFHERLLDAYHLGLGSSGEAAYAIRYLAGHRYMEMVVHPSAMLAITRCTDETVARLHRPESKLIVP